ncbi:hypothetical protein PAXRUDRAFT_21888 [Paxillus rubicundulus Ve08.2h10]|uniref:Uncharacterized protein n=1 Tax=Paxillus rubicundulus Ve08.2h10 TaxID=930991 RepID=A0A0D0BLJ3_9AGAM|nr:hypothetical protein PAXRUDRAFT_21888 [Paxillus rubicundulus Ve08.2h10]
MAHWAHNHSIHYTDTAIRVTVDVIGHPQKLINATPLTDDPPILAPASPAMSIPPVEVLAQPESALDNGGSGSSD